MIIRKMAIVFVMTGLFGCDGRTNLNDEFSKSSETAIYLPGGGGIDFGIGPKAISVIKDSVNSYQVISINVEHEVSSTIKAVKDVLEVDGYVEQSAGAQKFFYTKGGRKVAFKYSRRILDGLKESTDISISWAL